MQLLTNLFIFTCSFVLNSVKLRYEASEKIVKVEMFLFVCFFCILHL